MTAVADLLGVATAAELVEYERLLEVVLGDWHEIGRPEQLVPLTARRAYVRGGRGSGKTRTISETLAEWVMAEPPGEWAIVAPTYGDARDTNVEGPSGFIAAVGRQRVTKWNRSMGEMRLTNGSTVWADGADDGALRIQGKNLRGALADEVGLWKRSTWKRAWFESLMFALRMGNGRIIAGGTPKQGHPLVLALVGDPEFVKVHLRTKDNAANLSAVVLAELLQRYEGTRLGRQELEGEILEDVEGALWLQATIDGLRGDPPTRKVRYPGSPRDASGLSDEYDMPQVVVGVDPAASSSEDSDETGIVVAGRGSDGLLYVLADQSVRATPDGWGRRVIDACEDHGADEIVAEANNGGEMVSHVLRTVAQSLGMTPPIIRLVHASRGKRLRAEPIAAIYEQRRARHCGTFAALEQQMTEWVPDSPQSPDRLDALVWAATRLMIESRPRLRYRGAA